MAKSIEINTVQNVVIEYTTASLRERFLALLLDCLAVFIGSIIFIMIANFVGGSNILGSMGWQILFGLFPLIAFLLYNMMFEIRNGGRTPGKMALDLKVVRLDGKDPEWSDVLFRALLQLVDFFFSFGLIGAMLIKTTAHAQRFGDMAAHTTVIKTGGANVYNLRDILKIATAENHEVAYPQVRLLTEQDMVFIKQVLIRYQNYPNAATEDVVEDLVTRLMDVLDIAHRPLDRIDFLKTLLRDYIVLTR